MASMPLFGSASRFQRHVVFSPFAHGFHATLRRFLTVSICEASAGGQGKRRRCGNAGPSLFSTIRASSASAFGKASGRGSAPQAAHVFAIGTEYRQESVILMKCAEQLGYQFELVGFREPWAGFGTKLVQYERALRRGIARGHLGKCDPVLLIDGWDCALVGPAEEFRAKMLKPPYDERPIWYAGERICGPDFFVASRLDAIYPEIDTPWKYPNAGCMCGPAAECLTWIQELLQDLPEEGNDQGRLHLHLLDRGEREGTAPASVDYRCGIFQCLYEAEPQWILEDVDGQFPRLRNKLTGERPLVLHGNGHTGRWFMQALWREMRFLERIGLTHADLAHLPFDGAVAPGTVPDEATEKNWNATFQIYRIIEMQMAYARVGIKFDPWAEAEAAAKKQKLSIASNENV
eukprot:TRINITY_DN45397_c0_g1_i1.p1 TRINITY_DN45397_c0_g1~~TRINITY_DN45397_c0_g1_i1.p1  ORF type:complete len:405 (-),score=56.00 TRINITY_DN45397_c0_g1_i1:21-1235(-)